MTSTTCTIDDRRHDADAGADTYYAYNTLNQLTVKSDDAGYANPIYYHYDANGSLIKLHETADDARPKACPTDPCLTCVPIAGQRAGLTVRADRSGG